MVHEVESPCIIFDEGAMCLGVNFSRDSSIFPLQTEAKKSLICPFAHSSVKRGKSYLTTARGEEGHLPEQSRVAGYRSLTVLVRDEGSVGFRWTLKLCLP